MKLTKFQASVLSALPAEVSGPALRAARRLEALELAIVLTLPDGRRDAVITVGGTRLRNRLETGGVR